jgi:hypothetical protein
MVARTLDNTEAGTSSGEEEEEYMPPCRAAEQSIVPCPLCGRQVKIKTLRYSHRCARTFHTNERAQEQRKLADTAVLARMGQSVEQLVAHRRETAQPVAHGLETAQTLNNKQHRYANLLNF